MRYDYGYGSGKPIVYQGVVTGLRISSVATGAFLDNLPSAVTDLVTAAASSYSIQVCHGGLILSGVLASVGDGEDLGDELIAAWTNAGYETFTVDGTDITNANETSGAGTCQHGGTAFTLGELYKYAIGDFTTISGGLPTLRFCDNANLALSAVKELNITAADTAGAYVTAIVTSTRYIGYRLAEVGRFSATGNSVKKVTGPSTAGCVIESAASAADGTFTVDQWGTTTGQYNKAGYMVVVRKL